MAWVQGVGSLDVRKIYSREERIRRAFNPQLRAARVLEVGVQGVAQEAAAWDIVQRDVLNQLSWK